MRRGKKHTITVHNGSLYNADKFGLQFQFCGGTIISFTLLFISFCFLFTSDFIKFVSYLTFFFTDVLRVF